MRILLLSSVFCLLSSVLAGCSTPSSRSGTADAIQREMDAAAQRGVQQSKVDSVSDALLPPLAVSMPKVGDKPLETRFDLTVNNTSANQVFTAIVSGTRYSVLLHPEVSGSITLNLKDVTVFEALEAIHEIYGYDYKMDGSRIYIQPRTLQTRLFKIDYLAALRDSSSSLSVKASGQIAGSVTTLQGQAQANTTSGVTNVQSGSTLSQGANSSSVTTAQSLKEFNFWSSLEDTLRAIITPNDKAGSAADRSVVVNRMSGVIVVRAMPDELRHVKEFLEASRLSIERQVIIEAKFVEVTLNDSYQSGINWGVFSSGGAQKLASAGLMSTGSTLMPKTAGGAAQSMTNSAITAVPGSSIGGIGAAIAGSVFGLAFQTNNFGAMLNFLETQGKVNVLSSPRIATLNNQKAVLKVGTDEPYATGFTPGVNSALVGGVSTILPTPIYSQLFSGIALDVTPRINENDEIILHIHPSISQVTSKLKDTGSGQTLQMASTSIEETDSVVRAKGGQIVVIGGLMSQSTDDSESGIPGLWKSIFGQTTKSTQKRELVIMLKPTVVNSDKDWSDDISQSRDRFNSMNRKGAKP